jgi:hypothetical protein
MILLVCGGRKYADKAKVYKTLTKIHSAKPIDVLIQGGARGADALAKQWAHEMGVHCAQVDALWHKMGDAAGPPRNRAMALLRPDLVLGFPGGGGTRDMLNTALARKIKIHIIKE